VARDRVDGLAPPHGGQGEAPRRLGLDDGLVARRDGARRVLEALDGHRLDARDCVRPRAPLRLGDLAAGRRVERAVVLRDLLVEADEVRLRRVVSRLVVRARELLEPGHVHRRPAALPRRLRVAVAPEAEPGAGPRAVVARGRARVERFPEPRVRVRREPVWNSNLQPDFNVRVCDSFDATFSAVLRELDESNRFVQKSAESTSM